MNRPLILTFCPPADAANVTACIGRENWIVSTDHALAQRQIFEIRETYPMRKIILLGVGPSGCAGLAAYVAERGLEGVAAVVLVDPAAPWAERVRLSHRACGQMEPMPRDYTPLGPLEPLRAMAEMAIYGERCKAPRCTGDFEGTNDRTCEVCGDLPVNQLRLVLAVCPEAPRCTADGCDELGLVPADTIDGEPMWKPCTACSGTGRMLSSVEVAGELLGRTFGTPRSGTYETYEADIGVRVAMFITRATLLAHGLKTALRVALEGLT